MAEKPVAVEESGRDRSGAGMMHNRIYRAGALVAEDVGPSELAEFRRDTETVIWVDLLAPTPAQLAELAPMIGGDDPLTRFTLDSALSSRGRPRIVRLPAHKIVHVRSAAFDEDARRLDTTDIAIVVFEREVVTIRSAPGFPIDEVIDEYDSNADLAVHGVPFLLFSLLDQLVNGFLNALDDLDERILSVEDELLEGSGPGRAVQLGTFTLRRAVAALARIVLPTSEVLATIGRGGIHPAAQEMNSYLLDVYEHAIHASERIDGQRDAIEAILATSLSMQGNSLNEIMKKLTAWAAIIAIPTGVTGYFGQNVPFPGYGDKFGFWLSAALLIGLGGGLWFMFRRRDWL
ncbi:magnesium transporter CorA family protein [Aldersonia kunmingensis]|uniref:magnesium transporter CorA family protein n=1 Tax=Aldersonia kunmingensis TaxID=408066 RepID=UPI000AE319EA|nr:magnesium transporter CorA family protein [Aldersonia kunmingensis]